MVQNIYVDVSDYETYKLQDTLDYYGRKGFSLVSTQMRNKYGHQLLYLFFVRHTEENCKLLKGE